MLCEIHRRLFANVRDHAGRCRSAEFGSEYLTFGPNRSSHRSTVIDEVTQVLRETDTALASFEEYPDADNYEAMAIHVAVWTHAELIRVHPFEDGNGRTTRLFCDWLLIQMGLRPIPVEAVKFEYLDCLNEYFLRGNMTPIVDLYIRLYPLL
jgi:fido (protein-threonine AMPylation protein)